MVGHTNGQRADMISYTMVWRGIKKLVPFRSVKYQFIGEIGILRNGTEQKNKTCHRDRITRLTGPCPSHKNVNVKSLTFC